MRNNIRPPILEIDIPLKNFFKDFFHEVFIIFPPFLRFNNENLIDELPEVISKSLYLNAQKINWKKLMRLYDLKDCQDVQKLLNYRIGKRVENNLKYESILKRLNDDNILCQIEGSFPVELENEFLESFIFLNYREAYFNTQFGENETNLKVDNLISEKDSIEDLVSIYPVTSIYSKDLSIGYFVNWDHHCTLLCGKNKQLITKVINKFKFEGFFCNEFTTLRWEQDKKEINEEIFYFND